MSCPETFQGVGTFSVRGVLAIHNYGPVAARYRFGLHVCANGAEKACGTVVTDPGALENARQCGRAWLRLENGQELEITLLEVAGGEGRFRARAEQVSPDPGEPLY